MVYSHHSAAKRGVSEKVMSSVKFDIQELVDAGKLKFDLSLTMLDFLCILKSYSQEA